MNGFTKVIYVQAPNLIIYFMEKFSASIYSYIIIQEINLAMNRLLRLY